MGREGIYVRVSSQLHMHIIQVLTAAMIDIGGGVYEPLLVQPTGSQQPNAQPPAYGGV